MVVTAMIVARVEACGQTNWFKGLFPQPTPDTAITITHADYDSVYGWLWMGGTTMQAPTFGLTGILNQEAAIILYVSDSDS